MSASQSNPKPLWSAAETQQIAALRTEMLRFATLQLRDAVMAEDAVHDAINAALAATSYSGSGNLKSWVYSILRNKILDVFRERNRHPTEYYMDDDDNDLDTQFDHRGHWDTDSKPADWGQPEVMMANEQFWKIFEICLTQLPENTARVFMMREHLGLSVSEICNELTLSDSNVWVIMHRARSLLRKCLEMNFIQEKLQ